MKTQMIATVVGGLVLTLLHIATGIALGPPPGPSMPGNILGWLVAANVLIAGTLAWYARRSAWTGWKLATALFVVSYGIGSFNGLIEAKVFGFFGAGELEALLLQSLVPALLFAPVMVWLTGRWRVAGSPPAAPPRRSAASWIVRFAACAVAYLLLYFAAGMIIFPYVQPFYEQERVLPPATTVITLQLFLRGPIFVALGLLVTRIAPATRAAHALMVAVAMSVLGGVAPLLLPNPYFPDAVRWVHFAEVVTSHLVFGAVVGWLLGGSRQSPAAAAVSHAA